MRVFLIGIAGAVGALARYGIGVATGTRTFPVATLGINLFGSFLLGLLLHRAPVRLSEDTRLALGVGLLGAFTTFSTFTNETLALARDGRIGTAVLYLSLSIVGGLTAAAIGYAL